MAENIYEVKIKTSSKKAVYLLIERSKDEAEIKALSLLTKEKWFSNRTKIREVSTIKTTL